MFTNRARGIKGRPTAVRKENLTPRLTTRWKIQEGEERKERERSRVKGGRGLWEKTARKQETVRIASYTGVGYLEPEVGAGFFCRQEVASSLDLRWTVNCWSTEHRPRTRKKTRLDDAILCNLSRQQLQRFYSGSVPFPHGSLIVPSLCYTVQVCMNVERPPGFSCL